MAGVTYRPDRAGLRAMTAAPFMVKEMERRADLGRIEAERIAPVQTGAYAFGAEGAVTAGEDIHGGGFKVTSGVRDGHAYARLSNDVHRNNFCYAAALEFGTKYMRKQRILGRAIDAIASRS
jgi:hypothetical protein